MQYSHKIELSDGERILLQGLIEKYIEECNKANIPVGTFALNAKKKLIVIDVI